MMTGLEKGRVPGGIRRAAAASWRLLAVVAWLGIATGCAGPPPQPDRDGAGATAGQCGITAPGPVPLVPAGSGDPGRAAAADDATGGGCQVARETDGGSCFNLRPGRRIPCTRKVRLKNGRTKTVKTTTTTRCQPQSLIYARCRSGIDICRQGDTSPVQWYACASKQGAVSEQPRAGAVIILAGNSRRNMPTGHPAYVEEACPNADGTWSLRLSHTNYDRRCHLDRDARVIFRPQTKTACFVTGPWSAWAKDLKVLGFIVR